MILMSPFQLRMFYHSMIVYELSLNTEIKGFCANQRAVPWCQGNLALVYSLMICLAWPHHSPVFLLPKKECLPYSGAQDV